MHPARAMQDVSKDELGFWDALEFTEDDAPAIQPVNKWPYIVPLSIVALLVLASLLYS